MGFKDSLAAFRPFYAAFIVGGVGFATGIALGWTNSRILWSENGEADYKGLTVHENKFKLTFRIWHTNTGFAVSPIEFTLVVSSLNFGAIISSIPSGFIVDAIGRKTTVLLLFGPFILGWLLILAASDAVLLCLGRGVLGAASSVSTVVGPVYMYEVASPQYRGEISGMFKLQMTMGILFIYCLEAYLSTLTLILVCLFVHFVIFLPMFFIPETPLFLLWSNQPECAEKALRWLRGKSYDPTEELSVIRENLMKVRAFDLKPVGFCKSIKQRGTRKAIWISLFLASLPQLSAVNVIIMFSTTIFGLSASGLEPSHLTIILGCEYVVATLISIVISNRCSRRLLLLSSSGAIMISWIMLGIYFYCESKDIVLHDTMPWAPVPCLSITVISFSLGIGTVPYIMISEMFPPNLSGPATSVARFFFWMTGGLINILADACKRFLGIGLSFLVFAAIQFFCILFILFVVPETRGKNPFEILEMIANNKLY